MRVGLADDKLPKFTESRSSDEWVMFGELNDFPNHLIDLFNRSGKHNAICTGVADMIKGDGFKVKVPAPGLQQFIDKPNPFETLDDILEKVSLDLKLFGGFYLNCAWSRDLKNVVEIYHIPFQEIRVNNDGTMYFKNEKWGLGMRKGEVQKIPAFNPRTAEGGKSQILAFKQYRPGLKHYPLPDYIGCRQYIETDTEISNFHYNNIKHSFSNSTVITFFNGEPTEEEKRVISAKLKGQKTGTDNAGGVILNFTDKKDQAPEIVRLQPDEMDKQYLQLYTTSSDEIFIGHRITNPSIFGVKVAGQLGTRQDLVDSKEIFYTDYIKPKVSIIERIFNYVIAFVSGGEIYIEKGNSQDNAGGTQAVKPVQQAKQLTEDDILRLFEGCGEPETNYRIIKQKRLKFDFNFAKTLNIEISDSQKKVLEVIQNNPLLTQAEISNLTELSPEDVASALTYLSDEGMINISDAGFEVTDEGLKTIDEKNLITTEIFVKYKYAGPKDNRNRPFCHKVLEMNKLYTREDINNISDAAGYDVWKQRGGWYHNPNTDVNTPYCRHWWSQVIVKKKSR